MSTATSPIESVLVENRVFPPPADFAAKARISGMAQYQALCDEAERDYEGYWARLARENVQWTKPFTQVLDQSNPPFYKWFADGELNASANCLDKHMGTPVENKTAIIFEADGGEVTKVTYKELLARVSQFANALKARGVQKGDRVLIYMPMTIEGVVAMQACARIGATHSVVFGGFSAKAVQERIVDVGATAVITANYQMRGGKELPLKAIVDDAIALGNCEAIKTVFVYERTGTACNMVEGRDLSFAQALAGLKDGTIDAIACDHAPHAFEEKDVEYRYAPSGFTGLETSLGVILTELYHTGEFSLMEIVDKMSRQPAKILGIAGGSLAEGAVADITVFDPEYRWTVEPDKFYTRGKASPFAGKTLQGKAVLTMVEGKIVMQDGQVTA